MKTLRKAVLIDCALCPRLHKELCAGHITLKEAQSMLVNDWRIAYKKYYGGPQ